MRQLFGCLLVIAGCVGFAYLMCLELSDRIRFLKEICRIYEELQYYIAYQRTPVSEAMKAMARKQEPLLGEALCEVAEGMEKGKELQKLWQQSIGEALLITPLKEEERRLLLDFPGRLGYLEGQAQAEAFAEPLREAQRRIAQLYEVQKNRNKVVMSLGLAGGILLSLVLV